MSADLVQNALDDFRRSVEITRDVRFQANLRLGRRQRASSYVVSLLSLYVIGLSLIPNILQLQQFQNQILLACSIILSVFVIFTSLLDGSQNFYHQGELLHQCARKVATINHKLKNIDVQSDPDNAMKELQLLQREYQIALDDCPINHENVDFFREILRKPHLFPTDYPWKFIYIHKVYYWIRVILLNYSWLIPHVAAGLMISYVVIKYVTSGSTVIGFASRPS